MTPRNDDTEFTAIRLLDSPDNNQQIIERPKCGRIIEVYFDDAIEEPCMFRSMFQKIRTMSPDDELHLHISCPGGDVNTATQIYNELMACKGRTVAHLYHAYSAATFLVLACDEIKVYEHSTFMCHNVAYGVQAKGAEAKAMVNFVNRTSESILRDVYQDFLTADEIERILKDEDFWFDAAQIIARLIGWIPRRQRTMVVPRIWSTRMPVGVTTTSRNPNDTVASLEQRQ